MQTARSLPRSLATSVGTSGLDLGVFVLFSLFVSGPLLIAARWLSGAIGALANFAINRRWAFAAPTSRGTRTSTQLSRYALVAVGAVSLATALFAALKLTTPLDLRVLHLVSMALVWAAFTYPLLRGWVFCGAKN
ncbi:MAG: GtrA family protein [Deltaproteobacteria bacterium]|nr:GtrA family protein [Deltaproteobacteria bacterium]